MNSRADICLLVTRLIIGGIFVFSGWAKVADMSMTVEFFGSLNIPAFLAYIVSYGELIGGILLLIGLWTEYASIFLAVVMIVAICLTIPLGPQAFMTPLATLAGIIAILGNGAGKYSIRRRRMTSATN